ncbi:ERF family protein [Borreliella burgdorferi]|uniref:ERF family protein n=1 Tax=Borreliella burgdorferi TaxID=139 RepID=UPI000D030815|nr:ERF family protein [Borreliella burgdorferi]PRQ94709.1 single-stranded DNA-binding protein [Borreliella burgdorferi]PRR25897.1 single-stranded DNA-binding protein [Borreliella burgdorferi]PRR29577.1 single-stranded DNA-binding protein [Borreliella burgdorferi]PRR38218.1 single-stranded DNA-binding protein [Borreliella burgdorferi]
MENLSNNNNQEIQNNIQAKISFRKDMKTLKMNLPGIDKGLKGYGYKYQNFNEIVEEIENVIYKHNLELDFEQYPISKFVDGQKEHVIRTTFYSTSTGYEFSFDTPMLTENLQWNNESGSKNVVNTVPQLVGSAITYFKRYALVACLHIKSEVDTDAAPIYNNYENANSMPNKQVSVNQKQEQKKDRFYYYSVFKEALSNIKDWVNSPTTKDNINSIIQKISFIQNIDPNNVDDIKKIESDLISYFEKNSDFKSINYWAEIIKNYFKKNNKLKDLQDFEKFVAFKRTAYGPSPLIFFSVLKEYERFDEIFAA